MEREQKSQLSEVKHSASDAESYADVEGGRRTQPRVLHRGLSLHWTGWPGLWWTLVSHEKNFQCVMLLRISDRFCHVTWHVMTNRVSSGVFAS